MRQRNYTLLSPQDVGAGETKTINVDIRDLLSAIIIRWRCTNVTVSVMLAPVASCISKVELVDGSDVLFSASGAMIQAMNYFDTGVFPENKISLTVGGYFEFSCALMFGRWFLDESYAINPLSFKSLQLRITFDEDACNTTVTVNSMSVTAITMADSQANPQGFISLKEHFTYVMGASSHTYVDLPTDNVIKKIVGRFYGDTYEPITLLDNLKISVDGGRDILTDITFDDLYKMIRQICRPITEQITLDAAVTAKTIYANTSKNNAIAIDYDATAFVTAQSKFAAPTITGRKIALSASVDIKALTAIIHGELPHNVVPLYWTDDWSPSQWLDVRNNDTLKIDILSSSSAASTDTGVIGIESVRLT